MRAVPHMVKLGGEACAQPVPKMDRTNFIKRIVAGPGDQISIKEGHVFRKADKRFVPEKDSYIRRLRHESRVQLPDPDHDSRRSLVHDGRQPWRIRRQQVLGTGPNRMGHRRSLRHLLAPRPHRLLLGPPRSAPRAEPRAARAPRPAPAAADGAPAAASACSRSTGGSACASSPAPTRRAAAASRGRSWRRRCCSTTRP